MLGCHLRRFKFKQGKGMAEDPWRVFCLGNRIKLMSELSASTKDIDQLRACVNGKLEFREEQFALANVFYFNLLMRHMLKRRTVSASIFLIIIGTKRQS